MYTGKVLQTQAVKIASDTDEVLTSVIKAFEHYWLHGFHPDIGKDVITMRPNPPEGHRHVHTIPLNFPDKKHQYSYSDSATCWKEWASNPAFPKHPSADKIPTSDTLLFYFVDIDRTAYVFHFSENNSHQFMNSPDFKIMVSKVEDALEKAGKQLMPWKIQHDLFSEKWLMNKQS